MREGAIVIFDENETNMKKYLKFFKKRGYPIDTTISVARARVKHLWDRLLGIKHKIPIQHRLFSDIVEAEGEILGREIVYHEKRIYFTSNKSFFPTK